MNDRVDNQVVKMTFDNAKFSENVEDTIAALRKLERSLEFKDADKGLERIEGAAGNTASAMDDLSDSVDETRVKFSALQVIGVTVLSSLTVAAMRAGTRMARGLWEPIISGGARRSQNIANARFQIEGLLKDEQNAWQKIKEDIDYGVKDTAYGFDAAAKIASQLLASGTQIGDDMKVALRSISGVAAMTNSSYEDIGYIYATIKANGKLMTEQLRQFSARGLNVAAVLAETMGKSEQEINDMVSKGKISFEEFANAMDNTFGEHAKEANKTFSGALSNMRAALARTGAMFADPIFENLKNIFNDMRNIINDVNKTLSPIVDYFTAIVELQSSWFHKFAETGEVARTIAATLITIFTWIRPIIGALAKVGALNGWFAGADGSLSDFIVSLQLYGERAKNIEHIFVNIFESIKTLLTVVKAFGIVLFPLLDFVLRVLSDVFNISGDLSESVLGMHKPIQDIILALARMVASGLDLFLLDVYNILTAIPWKLIITSVKLVVAIVITLGAAVIETGAAIANLISFILDSIPLIDLSFTNLVDHIMAIGDTIFGFISSLSGQTADVNVKAVTTYDDVQDRREAQNTQAQQITMTGAATGSMALGSSAHIDGLTDSLRELAKTSDSTSTSLESSMSKSGKALDEFGKDTKSVIDNLSKTTEKSDIDNKTSPFAIIKNFMDKMLSIDILGGLKEKLVVIKNALDSLKSGVSSIFDGFGDFIKDLGKRAKEFITNINPLEVAMLGSAILTLGIIVTFVKILNSIVNTIFAIPKLVTSAATALSSMGAASAAMKYNAITGLIVAIGGLVAGFVILSQIVDPDKIEPLFDAILYEFDILWNIIIKLIWAMAVFQLVDTLDTVVKKVTGGSKINPFTAIAKTLLSLSAGMIALTFVIDYITNNFKPLEFIAGIGAVILMTAIFAGFIEAVSETISVFNMVDKDVRTLDIKSKKIETEIGKTSSVIISMTIAMTTAITAMTISTKMLSSLSWNDLSKGLVSIVVTLSILTASMYFILKAANDFAEVQAVFNSNAQGLMAGNVTSKSSDTLKFITSYVHEIGLLLLSLSVSLYIMDKIDGPSMTSNFLMLSAVMIGIGYCTNRLADTAKFFNDKHIEALSNINNYIKKFSIALIGLVASLVILSYVPIIRTSNWSGLIIGFASIIGCLATIYVFLKQLKPLATGFTAKKFEQLDNLTKQLNAFMPSILKLSAILLVFSMARLLPGGTATGLVTSLGILLGELAILLGFMWTLNKLGSAVKKTNTDGLNILVDKLKTISLVIAGISIAVLAIVGMISLTKVASVDKVVASSVAIGILLFSLMGLLVAVKKFSETTDKISLNVSGLLMVAGYMAILVLSVVAITASMRIIASMDTISMLVATASIAVLSFSFLFIVKTIASVSDALSQGKKDALNFAVSVAALVSSMVLVVMSINILNTVLGTLDSKSFIGSAIAFTATLFVVGIVMAAMNMLAKHASGLQKIMPIILSTVLLVGSIAGGIYLIMTALSKLGDINALTKLIAPLAVFFIGLSVVIGLIMAISSIPGANGAAAGIILSLAGMFTAIGVMAVSMGVAINLLKNADFSFMINFANNLAEFGRIVSANASNIISGLVVLGVIAAIISTLSIGLMIGSIALAGVVIVALVAVEAMKIAFIELASLGTYASIAYESMTTFDWVAFAEELRLFATGMFMASVSLALAGVGILIGATTLLIGLAAMIPIIPILSMINTQMTENSPLLWMEDLRTFVGGLSLLGISLIAGGALLLAGSLLLIGSVGLLLGSMNVFKATINVFYKLDPFGFIEDMRAFSGGIAILGIGLVLGGGLLTLGAAAGLIAAGVLWLAMKLFEQCSKLFVNITKNMRAGVASLVGIVTDIIESINDLAETLTGSSISEWFEVGRNIVQGLIEGIQDLAAEPLNVLEDIGNNIVDGFCSFFGIHSPSTVMWELAQFLMQGLSNGISDGSVDVDNGVSGFCSSIWNKVQNLGQNLPNLFSGEFNWQNMGGNFLTTLKNIVNFLNGNVTPAFEAAGLNAGAAFGNSASAGIYDALGKASVVMGEAMRAYEIERTGKQTLLDQYMTAYNSKEIQDAVRAGKGFDLKIGTSVVGRYNAATFAEMINAMETDIDRLTKQINDTNQLIRDAKNVNTLTTYDFIDLDKFLGGTSGSVGGITGSAGIASSISGASGAGSGINDTSRIGSGNNINSNNTYNFIQNNYSPEPLERTELYRQTRSQLNDFYGAMGY